MSRRVPGEAARLICSVRNGVLSCFVVLTHHSTHFSNSKHQCGDGTKASFMSRDILKDIANAAISEAMSRNKQAKTAQKVSVVVSSQGCSFL